MRLGEAVFIDSGAWIALAASADPWHARAREQWEMLERSAARRFTSVPVAIETFTFLDRKGLRELALRWRRSLGSVRDLRVLACPVSVLGAAWSELEGRRAQGVSLVDATSFVLMRGERIKRAFTFDYHFSAAGFAAVE